MAVSDNKNKHECIKRNGDKLHSEFIVIHIKTRATHLDPGPIWGRFV